MRKNYKYNFLAKIKTLTAEPKAIYFQSKIPISGGKNDMTD